MSKNSLRDRLVVATAGSLAATAIWHGMTGGPAPAESGCEKPTNSSVDVKVRQLDLSRAGKLDPVFGEPELELELNGEELPAPVLDAAGVSTNFQPERTVLAEATGLRLELRERDLFRDDVAMTFTVAPTDLTFGPLGYAQKTLRQGPASLDVELWSVPIACAPDVKAKAARTELSRVWSAVNELDAGLRLEVGDEASAKAEVSKVQAKVTSTQAEVAAFQKKHGKAYPEEAKALREAYDAQVAALSKLEVLKDDWKPWGDARFPLLAPTE